MDATAEVEQAKNDILSSDWKVQSNAADVLAKNRSKAVTEFLISLLGSDEPQIRNVAALAIRDIGDNNAVEPLFSAIFKKDNFRSAGTLVYALQTLDCGRKFKELFEILFYHNYEPKAMAFMILKNQEFEFTTRDILDVKAEWDNIKIHKEKCPDYESTKEMIQAALDGYLPYLEDDGNY